MPAKQREIGTTLPGNVLLPNEPYLPGPEYGKKISKERWFEFFSVILLLIGGVAFVLWRNSHDHSHHETPTTIAAAAHVLHDLDYAGATTESLFGRQFHGLTKDLGPLTARVDLIGEGPESPVETAIIQLVPEPGKWNPGQRDLQDAVNEVLAIAVLLVPSAGEAFEKAVNTMTPVKGGPRPHQKGVAGTDDGWKVTYVTYNEYDEKTANIPAIYLIVQRLSAGESPELAALNREMYAALTAGNDIRTRLHAAQATTN